MTSDQERLIAEFVEKGLAGDMDSINAIEDRALRGKVKSALVKAKRSGAVAKESKEDTKIPEKENQQDKQAEQSIDEKIKKMIEEQFPDTLIENSDSDHIHIKPEKWYDIANWLKSDSSLLFDSLQCQMGIDIGDDMLESRYNLHSMELDHYIEVRIAVHRSNPKIPSVEQIWRIADWFERETYDMLGIEYTGHRDLRRILLPDDWEGWPLRKDYQVQETYHGIVVPKMKEGWE